MYMKCNDEIHLNTDIILKTIKYYLENVKLLFPTIKTKIILSPI